MVAKRRCVVCDFKLINMAVCALLDQVLGSIVSISHKVCLQSVYCVMWVKKTSQHCGTMLRTMEGIREGKSGKGDQDKHELVI